MAHLDRAHMTIPIATEALEGPERWKAVAIIVCGCCGRDVG